MKISFKIFFAFIFSVIIPPVLGGALAVFVYKKTVSELLAGQKILFTQRDGQLLGLTSALVILVLFISFLLISRRLAVLLKRLSRATEEISKGNFDFYIKIRSRDELGILANRFNEMASRLKEATHALEDAKESLEVRVQARTGELEEVTQGLENKIKERTAELQDRIKELERFQNLSVGRELKMIELKKQILTARHSAEQVLGKKSKTRKKAKVVKK